MAEKAPNGKEKVTVRLVGEDGNIFAILGRCTEAMRKSGWMSEDVNKFREEVVNSGDYNLALAKILDYVEDTSTVEGEESEECCTKCGSCDNVSECEGCGDYYCERCIDPRSHYCPGLGDEPEDEDEDELSES